MKFQRFMTGRGNMGYGFQAATSNHPQATYLTVRDSDTGDSTQPVLELLTHAYGEIGAAASYHNQEGRADGYTDILFPIHDDPEWDAVAENPACLLYLQHINRQDFLKISNISFLY